MRILQRSWRRLADGLTDRVVTSSLWLLLAINMTLAVVVPVVLHPMLDDLPGPLADPTIEGAIVFIGAQILLLLTLHQVSPHIGLLRRIVEVKTDKARRPLLVWLKSDLEEVQRGFESLLTPSGWHLPAHDYNQLMQRFSGASPSAYVGTTADLPSVFRARYTWVFDRQDPADAETQSSREGCCRIIIATPEELIADRRANPKSYKRFVEWHTKYVRLYCIHPDDYKVLDNHDFGMYITLWPAHYGVKLEPQKSDDGSGRLETVRTSLYVPKDGSFEQMANYVKDLEDARVPFETYVARARQRGGRARPRGGRSVDNSSGPKSGGLLAAYYARLRRRFAGA